MDDYFVHNPSTHILIEHKQPFTLGSMNAITTFNLRKSHCDILEYAFMYIDEQLQFAIITHDNNSRLYSLHTQNKVF